MLKRKRKKTQNVLVLNSFIKNNKKFGLFSLLILNLVSLDSGEVLSAFSRWRTPSRKVMKWLSRLSQYPAVLGSSNSVADTSGVTFMIWTRCGWLALWAIELPLRNTLTHSWRECASKWYKIKHYRKRWSWIQKTWVQVSPKAQLQPCVV